MPKVHPLAVISAEAKLAGDVVVEPHAVIDGDVVIEAGCVIGSSVRIHSGTRLAEGVRVSHGAALGGEPQDLKFGGERTELYVGASTIIREFCTLNRGTAATGKTVVGANCLLMAYTHVAHDCVIGDNVVMANAVNLAGHVHVEEWAILGGMVPVHQFVRIGRHCMVGGGLRVPKDVPPYILAGGQPLRYYGLNSVGLRRRGFPTETRSVLKRAYRLLFQTDLNTNQALEAIENEFGSVPEVRNILEFARLSKRGLLPGNRNVNYDDE